MTDKIKKVLFLTAVSAVVGSVIIILPKFMHDGANNDTVSGFFR